MVDAAADMAGEMMDPPMDDMDPLMDDDMMMDDDDMMMDTDKEDDKVTKRTTLTEKDIEAKLIFAKPVNFSWWFQANIFLLAAFAGLIQGYQVGIIAGTELFLGDEYRGVNKNEKEPTTQEREFFVSFFALGAAVGALFAS